MGGEPRRPLLTRLQLLREMGLSPLWRLRRQSADVAQPLVGGRAAGPEAAPPSSGEAVVAAAPAAVPVAVGERNAEIAGMGWEELRQSAATCRACNLCQGRRQAVLGVGDLKADWLFIGEGPGAEEDARGEPFVGPAGKLLDAMLAAIDLQRGRDVYIANAVKCRPPGNRTPEPSEIAACAPFLRRQIVLLQPRLIVLLGRAAAHAVLGEVGSLANMRGRSFAYNSPTGGENIPVVVSYHPAYLLRTLHDKARAWEDLCRARALMRAAKATAAGLERAAGPDAGPTP
ncbi:MAG: uracil-DNA glycosylase, family 4 [Candidatus Accumulibacter adjunctus]|uniref:Type-4 uracil-DNA glycosylase n=1 Tax=Candidatus Accumulibacter adjunctus TaxID=1454001 RepID=A0A011N2E5_9PROT|nr:MAG: uracil-DNA glycosylase, family 4 [Candidatus Accumulibacter adjunctus]